MIDRNEACWVRLHPIAKQLNDSQWNAYTIVLKELDKSASERRGILIHGGPGAGKSFIIGAISEELVLRGKEILKAAFVSNQANAIGGLTLHNVTGINPRSNQKNIDQLSSVKLQELRDSHSWDSVEVFLVDEISSVPAFLLAYANDRMKTLKKCTTQPFGGLVPVYVGDFFQLPPPSSSSVAQTLVDSACSKGVTLNPNENTAVEQFKTFRRIDIEGNERGTDPLYKTLNDRPPPIRTIARAHGQHDAQGWGCFQ